MREDDSCAPHSPHTMSIQQVRPFGLGGFGVSSFSQFNLEQFREEFYLFFKKKKKKRKKKYRTCEQVRYSHCHDASPSYEDTCAATTTLV